MPEPRSVQIALDARGHGTVKINDMDISRVVRGLTLHAQVDELPTIELELTVFDISTYAEARLCIPEAAAAVLVSMGWTPPDDQPATEDPEAAGAPRDFVEQYGRPRMIGTSPGP